jgi:hypothetical protein
MPESKTNMKRSIHSWLEVIRLRNKEKGSCGGEYGKKPKRGNRISSKDHFAGQEEMAKDHAASAGMDAESFEPTVCRGSQKHT